ncbi:ECF-type sigma factor [Novipirellula aureliae]|uniref:ECF-type sigma factor n=1 Tax=Novipirellula aureliae TaxID=2527966 RepID=UPI0011B5FB23|nr:ECF-type sigma factor [Novipirellula aureliae]
MTASVNDVYLRLVWVGRLQRFHIRGHFFAATAEVKRRIRVDAARRRDCQYVAATSNVSTYSKYLSWLTSQGRRPTCFSIWKASAHWLGSVFDPQAEDAFRSDSREAIDARQS